nr:lytic transglycosylase domain-containing protein [Pseudomonadota bacterium]
INCSCTPALKHNLANASDLAEATKLIEIGNLQEAKTILNNYRAQTSVSPWVTLLSGKIEEKEKNYSEAFKIYSTIPKDEAASLDAELGKLRIKNKINQQDFLKSLSSTSALEQRLKNARRNDLLAELRELKSSYFPKKSTRTETNPQLLLLKSIKESWNKSFSEKTLSLISQFKKNYHISELSDELKFIYAKTLADMHKDKEAEASFLNIIESSNVYDYKIRSAKHLAWKAYFSGNISEAEKFFKRGKEISGSKLNSSKKSILSNSNNDANASAQEIRNYLADHTNFLYWQARCLEQLGDKISSQKLLEQIVSLAPYSFHAIYSLNQEINFQNAEKCKDQIDNVLEEKIAKISSYGVDEFTANEINWYYSKQGKSFDIITPLTNTELTNLTQKTSLLIKYKKANDAAAISDHAFRIAHFIAKEKNLNLACVNKLYLNSYPLAYQEDFESTATKFNIDPALTLAVARTESFFNPYARSSAEAKGLMQLLSSTAQNEGLKANESLYHPQTNIYYGTKHISGLAEYYQGKLEYAVAAYNAGKNATDRWLEKNPKDDTAAWIENISFPETRNYVQKVMTAKKVYEQLLK